MIKLYIIEHCYRCENAKRELKKNGIEYEELDGVQNIDYLIGLNQFEMPVIIENEKVISLDKLIEEWLKK